MPTVRTVAFRPMRTFAALWAFVAVMAAAPAHAGEQELFRIERSVNGNVVRYDARVRSDGTLDPEHPVTAYWVLAGQGSRREALTSLERSLAYGFSLHQSRDGLYLKLVACERRWVGLRKDNDGWHAELAIAGKWSVLRSIWVQVDSGFLGPRVRWIELRGSDRATGAPVAERLTNG